MRIKLFVEPKGKAREEVQLESSIPSDVKSFQKWRTSWIPKKEFKQWKKDSWNTEVLGELREGKIVSSVLLNQESGISLKKPLLAFRSFISDNTGAKSKLPMVVFGKVKKTPGLKYLKSSLSFDKDQESEIKSALKQDPWAPISVWHAQPVDRRYEIAVSDVLPHAIKYTKALFQYQLKDGNWSSFSETEQFK